MKLNYLEGLRRTFRVYLAVSALIAIVVAVVAIANTPRCKESSAEPVAIAPQMRESLGVPGLTKGILDAKAGGHSDDEIFRNLPMTKYAPAMKSARQAGLSDDQIAEILGLRLLARVIDPACVTWDDDGKSPSTKFWESVAVCISWALSIWAGLALLFYFIGKTGGYVIRGFQAQKK